MIQYRPFTALAVIILAVGLAFGAPAQPIAQFGGTPISASSGNVANANAVATLAAVAGKTAHICGFSLNASGATVGLPVSPTVVGVVGGTHSYTFAAVAGVLLLSNPVIMNFSPCIPASAPNIAIVVTLPALGVGNTNATANAWGYYY